MKNKIYIIILMINFIFVVGCGNSSEKMKEINMTEDELYDIYYIREAPKASYRHELSEVIKVVFTTNDSSNDDTMAVNVQENGIYINPSISSLGVRATKGMEQVDDIVKVINILEKYNVQDWKEDYTFEDPSSYEDGFAWSLYLQFEDGTVERHKGSGSFAEEITPDKFNEFYNEMNDFIEERLEE